MLTNFKSCLKYTSWELDTCNEFMAPKNKLLYKIYDIYLILGSLITKSSISFHNDLEYFLILIMNILTAKWEFSGRSVFDEILVFFLILKKSCQVA